MKEFIGFVMGCVLGVYAGYKIGETSNYNEHDIRDLTKLSDRIIDHMVDNGIEFPPNLGTQAIRKFLNESVANHDENIMIGRLGKYDIKYRVIRNDYKVVSVTETAK